ncbi:hypothetical protein [Chitinophaga deserti]|uniref:hypothetical protein n=1 Tax=Chitinophaga deserti TaxID=2164099 RepID=UPI000D6BDF9F|nr:hypothetical protein [Chitinophaga deserti]
MAILDSIIPFTGKLGNIISYKRNGKHCLRTKPEQVRQTANTRQAAKWFGAASRKGALIRSAITPELDIYPDSYLVNRLNSYIMKAGRNNHAGLKNFRFNGYTGLDKLFPQLPVFSKDGTLHIPAQRLEAYGNNYGTAKQMEVKLIATRIDFATRSITGTDAVVMTIDLEQPFNGAEMSIEVPGKGTLLVVVQVRQIGEDGDYRDRNWFAADIVAVVEDQQPEVSLAKNKSHKKLAGIPSMPPRKAASTQNRQAVNQRE